jgi:hypothetical protein
VTSDPARLSSHVRSFADRGDAHRVHHRPITEFRYAPPGRPYR